MSGRCLARGAAWACRSRRCTRRWDRLPGRGVGRVFCVVPRAAGRGAAAVTTTGGCGSPAVGTRIAPVGGSLAGWPGRRPRHELCGAPGHRGRLATVHDCWFRASPGIWSGPRFGAAARCCAGRWPTGSGARALRGDRWRRPRVVPGHPGDGRSVGCAATGSAPAASADPGPCGVRYILAIGTLERRKNLGVVRLRPVGWRPAGREAGPRRRRR